MALSTYLPLPERLDSEISAAAKQMTVFMAHGTQDDVVAIAHGRRSRDLLMAQDIDVDWHEYDMRHSVCIEEISHIRQWLIKQLG
jgi:phospholipase/carboxylesterase